MHTGSTQQDRSAPPGEEHAEIEPRWPALLAILVAGGLYSVLSDELSIGPRWLLLAIVGLLAIPNLISHQMRRRSFNNVLGFVTEGIVTAFLLTSVVQLVRALPGRRISPVALLYSAGSLWLCNVVIFALWYWRLDGGGPYGRGKDHVEGAFLFPPMTGDGRKMCDGPWSPRFVDYLFLAFNTSTAFSPTDTPIISRWAKILVMVQSLISLTLVGVLAARAVNLL